MQYEYNRFDYGSINNKQNHFGKISKNQKHNEIQNQMAEEQQQSSNTNQQKHSNAFEDMDQRGITVSITASITVPKMKRRKTK
jgi:hypothetical protein